MLVQCAVAGAGLGPTYGSVTEKTMGIQFLGVRGYPMTGDSGIYDNCDNYFLYMYTESTKCYLGVAQTIRVGAAQF